MKIYPAIDIQGGQCVRLFKGQYDQKTVYDTDPCNMAKRFVEQGATDLHIVDLDGAKLGKPVNLDIILRIKKQLNVTVQLGGGIRDFQTACDLLKRGIDKIIIGSTAIANPDEIKKWLKNLEPEKIVLALDTRNEKLALHGWETSSEMTVVDVLCDYQNTGLKNIICTDIERDGTLAGPNITLYQKYVKNYPDILFQASGGIASIDDVKKLAEIPVSGAIMGKALYENKFSLSEALNVS